MPRITPDDVLAGVKALWAGSQAQALVTGGIHHGVAQAEKVPPYANLMVEEGETEQTTGGAYTKWFTVSIKVYARADAAIGESPATTTAIRRAVQALIGEGSGTTLAVTNGRMLFVKPIGGEHALDPDRREGSSVLMTQARWEVLIQGSRV